jgi:hypothetical protein
LHRALQRVSDFVMKNDAKMMTRKTKLFKQPDSVRSSTTSLAKRYKSQYRKTTTICVAFVLYYQKYL